MLRKLASQTAIYGVSTIITRFLNYLLTPYLTYRLAESVIGVQGYFYAIIPFGLTILTMGFESGYFRFYRDCDGEQQKRELFSSLLTFIASAALIFLTIALLFRRQIYAFADSVDLSSPSIIVIVGAIIAVDAILTVVYSKLRAESEAKRFMMTKVFNVVVNLIITFFFYSILPKLAERGVFTELWDPIYMADYLFIANLIASCATLLILLKEIKFSKPIINFKIVRNVVLFSLPLMIGGVGGNINELLDRQFLAELLPKGQNMVELGIYSAVMKIAAFVYLFTQMYRFAAEPFFLVNVKDGDFKSSNAQAMKYFLIVSMGIFLVVTLYIDVFKYLVGEPFRVGLKIVPQLLISYILAGVYVNLSFWYKLADKTYLAMVITGVGVVATVCLNLILVPKMGYVGAAWSRLGCQMVVVAVSYYLNQRFFPIKYDFREIGKYIVLTTILYAISSFINIEIIAKLVVNSILFTIFVFYFVKNEKINVTKELSNLINRLKKR